jgi:hypothetical protein
MEQLLAIPPWAVALAIVWIIPWKGFALWKAARLYDRNWFIVILVLNTFAILDIIYIFLVARKKEQAEGTAVHAKGADTPEESAFEK